MSAFSYDGFTLHDDVTYTVLAAGSAPGRPAPLRHVLSPHPGTPRLAAVPRPPGTGSVTLAILVRGDLAAGTLGANLDALLRVLAVRAREPRWLTVTLGTSTRRALAVPSSVDVTELLPALAKVTVTFVANGYWESTSWSSSVQTGALSSLVLLGMETGLAYGHRLSLTPGGNAPVTPRVLLCVQSGSQTPTRFTLRALGTTAPEATSLNQSLAAGTALSFDPYLWRAVSLSLTNVRGWWPLAETGGTLRDFSSGSRDLSHTSSYKTAVTADTPAGWWRFEETSGTSAADSYGANTGTYQNSPTLGVTGLITEAGTYAVTLNGTNQYVTVPDAAALDLTDTWTVEAWIRRGATLGTNQVIVDKGTGAYQMRFNTSNQLESLKANYAVLAHSSVTITDTNIHHIVATKNGATVKLYVDGVDVSVVEATDACTNNATQLWIGANTASVQYFTGTVDEVTVYSTALSAARVLAHYTAGTAADNVLYLQDGPLLGGVNPGWPAVDCDGAAGEFTSSSADFSLTSHIVCGAWVQPDAIGSLMGILGKATTNAGFWLGVTAAGLLTGGVGSGAATRSATGTTTLTAGRWYHAVLVWDATAYSVTLYLDGELEAIATGGALTVGGYSGNFLLGSAKDLTTTTRYWNGKLSEPFVLNNTITQTQVRNVYQRGLAEYNPTVRVPLGWPWPVLHGEAVSTTQGYEVRVTHAASAPDLRVAVAWHPAHASA